MNDWHIRKEISIGNIVTIVLVTIAGVTAWNKVDARIANLEDGVTRQAKTDAKQDQERKDASDRVYSELTRLNDKLDRLIERK